MTPETASAAIAQNVQINRLRHIVWDCEITAWRHGMGRDGTGRDGTYLLEETALEKERARRDSGADYRRPQLYEQKKRKSGTDQLNT